MADSFSIDLDSLTVNEIIKIEEITGEAIDDLFTASRPRGKALQAIGYVVKHRENPDFTLEQAGELVISLKSDPTTAASSKD